MAVLLVLFLLPVAAWALDASMSANLVVRNAELGGQSVGGMNTSRLAPMVAATAQRLAGSPIEIATPGGPLLTSAAEVGLVVDQQTTVTNAIDLDSRLSWWKRPFEWLRSFVAPREVPVLATLDDAKLTAVVAQRDPTRRVEPVEPTITTDGDGALQAVKGINGHGLDPATVRGVVLDAAARGTTPLRATVADAVLRPRFGLADADRLARQADALTSTSISVEAGDTAATVTPAMLRSWARSVAGDVGLVLDLDDADGDRRSGEAPPRCRHTSGRRELQGRRRIARHRSGGRWHHLLCAGGTGSHPPGVDRCRATQPLRGSPASCR